ncbi:MAG: undecaprenyl/decaprenyl-phosphate alpha-N-acetylglucosaminyl 1-phosphate transferase [Bergeyella sp.]|nr:undecaprenyl/decaprenyl-phosphate alpha-N-acetylglucosaminyl 1-phosphate transferase [Bergeyella sp.]
MTRLEAFFDFGISAFYVKIILSFIFTFLICFYSTPSIIRISKLKNLMDLPGERSVHQNKIPNLGGVTIFYAIGICASIFAYELFDIYKFLFSSLLILLYVGVMDDIIVIKVRKKFLAQVLVSFLTVIGSDVRIKSMFGLFGIYELNYYVSVAFTIFSFVGLINAFNLIDGIDGLAGSYAILSSFFFGISFLRLGSYYYPLVILSVIIVASVLAFLHYNLSNYRSIKIFMGDTGSMILGFLLAFMAFCFIDIFINKKDVETPKYHLMSAPIISMAILILPIIDTLNVIIVRLRQKRLPFEADRSHIHHKLLTLGLSHRMSTFYILVYYVFVVLVAYFLRHLENTTLLVVILSLGFFGAYLPDIIKKMRKN